MTALLAAAAVILCLAALRELGETIDARHGSFPARLLEPLGADRARTFAGAAVRLGIPDRLVRAGMTERLNIGTVLGAKALCALGALPFGLLLAPAAPGRLSLLIAVGLPAAGFLAPDAWLEHHGRLRARRLTGALPDALDLLAVGAASGRSPTAAMAEIAATQDGPLARELGIAAAELACGASQSEALRALKKRAPGPELASLVAVIERSARYGSPLTEQLRGQATTLRGDLRRRVEEQAARAAPKIQLVVALLLVPSVLLMIAAALIANADVLTAGF